MQSQDSIEARYRDAVDSLVAKVQKDPNVLAAIVAGSFSYAQVWEKSDLDVEIIGRDAIRPTQSFFLLVENGINIHASITPRNKFKQMIERAETGSFMHSYFSHSTLLFSRDDTIAAWYDKNASRERIGERDKQAQLLDVVGSLLPTLVAAEKELYLKGDYLTAFVYLLNVVQGLARVEVLLNDEVPTREVIEPARRLNPDFFNRVYTDLIQCEKNEQVIAETLEAINAYLDERMSIFQPILAYLIEQKTPRTNTELNADLDRTTRRNEEFEEGADLDFVCQWLTWKGVIRQVAMPLKLTVKSQVSVEEPAYFYDDTPTESEPSTAQTDPHAKIHRALESLTETLQADRYIRAAILTTDLSEKNVWERTTPQLTLILQDGAKSKRRVYQLMEGDVPFRVELHTRSAYKKRMETQLQGSSFHYMLSKSRVLFSKDNLFAETEGANFRIGDPSCLEVGDRDRQSQLFNIASFITAILAKAEKWFHLKQDMDYTFLYVVYAVIELARIEALLHGETPKTKVLYQARTLNPTLFDAVFTDLVDKPKDRATLGEALEQIDNYLADNLQTLFKPLLDFLEDSGDERTITDIYTHFGSRQLFFELACEWLAQKGVIEQFSAPLRLTKDSKVSVEEPAYFYDANNPFL